FQSSSQSGPGFSQSSSSSSSGNGVSTYTQSVSSPQGSYTIHGQTGASGPPFSVTQTLAQNRDTNTVQQPNTQQASQSNSQPDSSENLARALQIQEDEDYARHLQEQFSQEAEFEAQQHHEQHNHQRQQHPQVSQTITTTGPFGNVISSQSQSQSMPGNGMDGLMNGIFGSFGMNMNNQRNPTSTHSNAQHHSSVQFPQSVVGADEDLQRQMRRMQSMLDDSDGIADSDGEQPVPGQNTIMYSQPGGATFMVRMSSGAPSRGQGRSNNRGRGRGRQQGDGQPGRVRGEDFFQMLEFIRQNHVGQMIEQQQGLGGLRIMGLGQNIDNMDYDQLLNLRDQIGVVHIGLSEDVFNMLPCYKFKKTVKELKKDGIEEDQDACPICLEEFEESDDKDLYVVCLPCTHRFHRKCIYKWLMENKSCAVCKTEVV
ncbi:MAG: hypothetical protein EZS28_010851, partial [Streblomastix strix]